MNDKLLIKGWARKKVWLVSSVKKVILAKKDGSPAVSIDNNLFTPLQASERIKLAPDALISKLKELDKSIERLKKERVKVIQRYGEKAPELTVPQVLNLAEVQATREKQVKEKSLDSILGYSRYRWFIVERGKRTYGFFYSTEKAEWKGKERYLSGVFVRNSDEFTVGHCGSYKTSTQTFRGGKVSKLTGHSKRYKMKERAMRLWKEFKGAL